MRAALTVFAFALVAVARVGAQAPPPSPSPTPAPASAQVQTPAPAANPAGVPPQPEAYTYQANGRRDPFLNLIGVNAGLGSRGNSPRNVGASGISVAEISVRGVLQTRSALIAMIQGPDNRTYIVHQGDKLLDGTIKSITPQGLVLLQDVNDPLSLVKQREVSKLLRSLEGVK